MQIAEVESHTLTIWMAGDVGQARRVINALAAQQGLCVTVTPTTFIYSGGTEEGMAIGLINYPKFPSTPEALDQRALELAQLLTRELNQRTATIVGPRVTRWVSREVTPGPG